MNQRNQFVLAYSNRVTNIQKSAFSRIEKIIMKTGAKGGHIARELYVCQTIFE